MVENVNKAKQLLDSWVSVDLLQFERCPSNQTNGETVSNKSTNHKASTKPSAQTTGHRSFTTFMQRVGTFTLSNWVDKPVDLSPLHCARYGWTNKEKDVLQCVTCSTMVSAEVPLRSPSYPVVMKRVVSRLQESHDSRCPWKMCPSPKCYVTANVLSRRPAFENFLSRCRTLMDESMTLPLITHPECERLSDLRDLPLRLSSMLPSSDHSPGMLNDIIMISLFGWRARCDRVGSVLVCSMCQRSVGLWNYNSPDPEDPDQVKPFAVDQEHRPWCPWVQSIFDYPPLWTLLLDHLTSDPTSSTTALLQMFAKLSQSSLTCCVEDKGTGMTRRDRARYTQQSVFKESHQSLTEGVMGVRQTMSEWLVSS